MFVCRFLIHLAVFMTFSDTILSAPTSTLDENARLLARRVAGSLQGSTVSCANRNLALLSEDNYLALINAFQDELQRRGVKISPQHATAKIVLTISKRVTDYLGVVQILRGEETETILEPFGRVSDASVVASVLSLQLRKEFLFDQDQPILDIHSADNFKHAMVLGLGEIAAYERKDDNWVLSEVTKLPITKAPVRPLSGSLTMGIDEITARLGGDICVFPMLALDRAKWACKPESGTDSNSSTKSVNMWGKKSPPWISAASLESGGRWVFIISGGDGILRLYEDGPNPVASFSGWGSEIASVQSPCGAGWQLLTSSSADWTSKDIVTGVEIQERLAVRATNPVEFPGPVISLQSSMDMAKGPSKAVAIVRNLQTGKYEAYVLSITCTD